MSPRGPPRALKTENPAFAKTLKNLWFFKVFGVQRPPKRASRGPKGSQEAPKELQNLKKKGSKNALQNKEFLDQFWSNFGGHSGAKNCSKRGPKIEPFLEPLSE